MFINFIFTAIPHLIRAGSWTQLDFFNNHLLARSFTHSFVYQFNTVSTLNVHIKTY